jgi:two-component system, response regulator PdtaR
MTSGKPVILVVEDEFVVRMLAVSVAQHSGFEVLSAGTADEAIKILESRSDIRLVFTDVNMPGSMDGLRLAHAVRNRWPPVEVIVTSGHGYIRSDELPDRGRSFAKRSQRLGSRFAGKRLETFGVGDGVDVNDNVNRWYGLSVQPLNGRPAKRGTGSGTPIMEAQPT